jgi:hypothetical protein
MGEGRERIPRKTLKFFGEARCAVPCLLCCCTLARLPCRCRTVPSTMDINIDAGTDQSVIRATLLRYTLKSLPVNILVCGKRLGEVEDSEADWHLNSTPNKGFSRTFLPSVPSRSQSFHNRASGSGLERPRPQPWRPSRIRRARYTAKTRLTTRIPTLPALGWRASS